MEKFYEKDSIIKYVLLINDIDIIKCNICLEFPHVLYTIFKRECIKYSYCKNCIKKIEKDFGKCPFTRSYFTYKDIILDDKKNELIDIYNKYNKLIKNVKLDIEIDKLSFCTIL